MATHLVQISDGAAIRLAMVDEPNLRCLTGASSTYDLVLQCLRESVSLEQRIRATATGETMSYDEVYLGHSRWRLLAPIHVPDEPSRLLISGTGLTHIGSARQRQVMHQATDVKEPEDAVTDSMRMFQCGIEGGRPPAGKAGIAPEWFYKGDGSGLRAPNETLVIPSYAENGGEEAELAGVYIVDQNGNPCRIGFVQGNEFSDHAFEKRNYLNLAGSKLRACSLGPELVIGAAFADVTGKVRILRAGAVLWVTEIASGELNMCHSLENIEHHHFKFEGHRRPGSAHVHFFGADALSFGAGIVLADGDVMEVEFEGFGRALRNIVHVETRSDEFYSVRPLA